MSIYTEAEHAIGLNDTMKWIEHPPLNAEERYAYGLYQLRLKDYNEALHHLLLAAEDGANNAWFIIGQIILREFHDEDYFKQSLPSDDDCFKKAWYYTLALSHMHQLRNEDVPSEVLYRMAWMLRYGLGTDADTETAYTYFSTITNRYDYLSADDFNITCDYSTAGSNVTKSTDWCRLPIGASWFELADYYAKGISPVNKNTALVHTLLLKAYDCHCEEALFLDFDNCGQNYKDYDRQDDIRELYSYRIGQYGRICDTHPSKKAYMRIIAMYENGYPGDEGAKRDNFAKKSLPYYKKIEQL